VQLRLPLRLSRAPGVALGAIVAASVALSGCIEIIGLGSECPPQVLRCPDLPPFVAPSLDAAVVVAPSTKDDDDAGIDIMLGNQRDEALEARDASADGDVLLPVPALANWSFELTQGEPGDITAISLPSFTSIAPWFTCQPIGGGTTPLTAVRAERELQANTIDPIGPTDRAAFTSIRYFASLVQVPLVQKLNEPLRAGHPYAFSIDVRATGSVAHLSLQVRGANDCLSIGSPELLAESDPVQPGDWQRICVAFTPLHDHAMLLLQVNSNPQTSDDLLLLDNIGAALDCPEIR
jgi:hypothetical protein